MPDKVFFDTNIFVYCFDQSSPEKMTISRELLFKFSLKESSVISYQVLQEFLNVCYKLNGSSTLPKPVFNFIKQEMYVRWQVNPSIKLYEKATDIKRKYQFSFYDSLIIAAAIEAKCATLFSEDLQHQQKVESVEILNPYVGVKG